MVRTGVGSLEDIHGDDKRFEYTLDPYRIINFSIKRKRIIAHLPNRYQND